MAATRQVNEHVHRLRQHALAMTLSLKIVKRFVHEVASESVIDAVSPRVLVEVRLETVFHVAASQVDVSEPTQVRGVVPSMSPVPTRVVKEVARIHLERARRKWIENASHRLAPATHDHVPLRVKFISFT